MEGREVAVEGGLLGGVVRGGGGGAEELGLDVEETLLQERRARLLVGGQTGEGSSLGDRDERQNDEFRQLAKSSSLA